LWRASGAPSRECSSIRSSSLKPNDRANLLWSLADQNMCVVILRSAFAHFQGVLLFSARRPHPRRIRRTGDARVFELYDTLRVLSRHKPTEFSLDRAPDLPRPRRPSQRVGALHEHVEGFLHRGAAVWRSRSRRLGGRSATRAAGPGGRIGGMDPQSLPRVTTTRGRPQKLATRHGFGHAGFTHSSWSVNLRIVPTHVELSLVGSPLH